MAFRPRVTITLVPATTAASATTATTAAKVTLAAGFASLATRWLAFGARSAVFTLEAAALSTAATTTAMAVTISALITIAARFATDRRSGGRFSWLRPEQAFQPTDKSGGFLLGLNLRLRLGLRLRLRLRLRLSTPILVSLVLARFKPAIVAALTAPFAVLAKIAAFTTVTAFAALTTIAAVAEFAAFATFTVGTKRRTLLALGRSGFTGLPVYGFPFRLCGRKDLQLGFFLGAGGVEARGRLWNRLSARRRRSGGLGDRGRRGRSGGGLRRRLVGAGRVHRCFAGERILVLGLRCDDLDRGWLVAGGTGGWRSAGGGRGVAFAAGEP